MRLEFSLGYWNSFDCSSFFSFSRFPKTEIHFFSFSQSRAKFHRTIRYVLPFELFTYLTHTFIHTYIVSETNPPIHASVHLSSLPWIHPIVFVFFLKSHGPSTSIFSTVIFLLPSFLMGWPNWPILTTSEGLLSFLCTFTSTKKRKEGPPTGTEEGKRPLLQLL